MEAILKKKRRFRIMKLEERITPDLTLPNGMVVFEGFDNPSPVQPYGGAYGPLHPTFIRADAARDATMGTPTDGGGYGNEGPWSAHYMSDVICAEELGTC